MLHLEKIQTIIDNAKSSDPNTIIYLLGSYAQGTETPKSDVDVLILHQNKEKLARDLKKVMKNWFPIQYYDIKILNHNELNKVKNRDYFLLYSMIKFGRKLIGKEIRIKFQPERLRHECDRQMELLERLTEDVEQVNDFQIVAALIFGLGKSLHFLERIVIEGECKKLKEIFKRNLVLLGKEYELVSKKQGFVKTSLSQSLTIKGKGKKGNYPRLLEAIEQVREYGNEVKELFENLGSCVDDAYGRWVAE